MVICLVILCLGSTYSLSKFSRLHYKSFKSLDHNVHSVWHVKRGNMNVTPLENVKLLVHGDQFQPQTQGIYRVGWSLGRSPAAPPLGPNTWAQVSHWCKTTRLPPALENLAMEATTRNSSLSQKNLKRIQGLRCTVWFHGYYKTLKGVVGAPSCVSAGSLAWRAGDLQKPQCSLFCPWFFFLLKLRSFSFMGKRNISPLGSFPAQQSMISAAASGLCFPNFSFGLNLS